jgi:hypothetical protein
MGSVIMTIKTFLTVFAKNDGGRLKGYEKNIPPSPIRDGGTSILPGFSLSCISKNVLVDSLLDAQIA